MTILIDENGHSNGNIDYRVKSKKQKNKSLVVSLLELIQTKKTFIFLELSMSQ